MGRFHSYLNTSVRILQSYSGDQPFNIFLKNFFSGDKKYGSRDRKQISELCYCYFRLGKALPDIPIDERILFALFFCSSSPNSALAELRPEWNDAVMLPFGEKLKLASLDFSGQDIFPWIGYLSDTVDAEKFALSHLTKPDLFIRIRPGYFKQVKNKLKAAEVEFEEKSESSFSFINSTKLDSILEVNKEAVIQDQSSQATAEFIQMAIDRLKPDINLWDCCAASGGKTIMAYDIYPEINITVSDNRESILSNLKKRFKQAGIKQYKSFIADISKENFIAPGGEFNFIIADVPCSGSGTWGRTPEQLYYFELEKLDYYSSIQRKILSTAFLNLEKGGYLVYITCSVFKKENEDAIEFAKTFAGIKLIRKHLFAGYDSRSDTLFAAIFQKEL